MSRSVPVRGNYHIKLFVEDTIWHSRLMPTRRLGLDRRNTADVRFPNAIDDRVSRNGLEKYYRNTRSDDSALCNVRRRNSCP